MIATLYSITTASKMPAVRVTHWSHLRALTLNTAPRMMFITLTCSSIVMAPSFLIWIQVHFSWITCWAAMNKGDVATTVYSGHSQKLSGETEFHPYRDEVYRIGKMGNRELKGKGRKATLWRGSSPKYCLMRDWAPCWEDSVTENISTGEAAPRPQCPGKASERGSDVAHSGDK